MKTPQKQHWYVVELIERFKFNPDDERYTTYINYLLVEGDSDEVAYERALALGDEFDRPAEDSIFFGMRDMRRIKGELVDGAVLYHLRPRKNVSDEKLKRMLRAKTDLAVFATQLDEETQTEEPPYIPEEAVWYLAEYLHQSRQQSEIVVEPSFGLIYALSPEAAFRKAMKRGEELSASQLSNNGHHHRQFLGLGDLSIIDDPVLAHGTEIIYEDWYTISDEKLERMRREKAELTLFK